MTDRAGATWPELVARELDRADRTVPIARCSNMDCYVARTCVDPANCLLSPAARRALLESQPDERKDDLCQVDK